MTRSWFSWFPREHCSRKMQTSAPQMTLHNLLLKPRVAGTCWNTDSVKHSFTTASSSTAGKTCLKVTFAKPPWLHICSQLFSRRVPCVCQVLFTAWNHHNASTWAAGALKTCEPGLSAGSLRILSCAGPHVTAALIRASWCSVLLSCSLYQKV